MPNILVLILNNIKYKEVENAKYLETEKLKLLMTLKIESIDSSYSYELQPKSNYGST